MCYTGAASWIVWLGLFALAVSGCLGGLCRTGVPDADRSSETNDQASVPRDRDEALASALDVLEESGRSQQDYELTAEEEDEIRWLFMFEHRPLRIGGQIGVTVSKADGSVELLLGE